MVLYLLQHGEAVSEVMKPERPLSEKGIEDVKKVAQFLKKRKICIDAIWHSAKLRAIQTAEIILQETGVSVKKEKCEELAPNDPIEKILERIKLVSTTEEDMALMIVGHLPYLQKLSDYLLTGTQTAGLIRFQQGGVVCLEKKQGKWQLCWQIIPDILP